MKHFHSSPIDEEKCTVRFVDTGDFQDFKAHEVYALNESFETTSNQAYTLHLTGVIPADKEDDWDPSITDQVKKELNKWINKESETIYEANVVFALRNTLVVDIMRLVNLSRGVVHCSLKSYLQNRSYGIISSESCKKVIEMAKNAGKVNVLFQIQTYKNLMQRKLIMVNFVQVSKLLIPRKQKRKNPMNYRLHARRLPMTKVRHPTEMNRRLAMETSHMIQTLVQASPHTKRRATRNGQVHGRHSIVMLKSQPTIVRTIFMLFKSRNCMYFVVFV